jgi:acyl carrier protein
MCKLNNLEKYKGVFEESFQCEDVESLNYQDIPEWDSVGHMGLVAALEDMFEIELDVDDIIDMSSYKIGQEILSKYGVLFSDD